VRRAEGGDKQFRDFGAASLGSQIALVPDAQNCSQDRTGSTEVWLELYLKKQL